MTNKDNNQKENATKSSAKYKEYVSNWQKQNRDKVYAAQNKWKASNQDYVRYKRAFSAAKNFIQPKEGSVNEKACQWALSDKNDKANYIEDLHLLKQMIEKRLKKVEKNS